MSYADEQLEKLGYIKYQENNHYIRYKTSSDEQLDFDIKNNLFRIRSRSAQGNIFANYVNFDLAYAINLKIEELAR